MSDLYGKEYQHARVGEPVKKPKRKKGFLFWASLVIMIAALIALAVIGAGYLQGCLMYKSISDDTFDNGKLKLEDMKVD